LNTAPTGASAHSRLAYRKDIDGLRAVAVVPVVLFHAGIDVFSGGYVGVDVFFVISGYLITALIVPEIAGGQFSYRDFYERRIRRLFPALFAMLALCCAAAFWLLMPFELEDFGQSVSTTSLFSANFLFLSEEGYFEGPAEQKPLLHTWSLAVEEQYYLLFPLLLVLLRRTGGRYLAGTAIVLAASLAWSIYGALAYPSATFYLLPGRTWELLLGSVLAIWHLQRSPAATTPDPGLATAVTHAAAAAGGLAMIMYAVFTYDSTTVFPGAAALLPCGGTALLIHSGSAAPSAVSRMLAWPPLVFIGLISYSLYLWHWPVIVFSKHYLIRAPLPGEVLAMIVVSLVLAVLSWRYVERPFRGRAGWLTQRGLFRVTGAVMTVAIAIGLLYDESEGLPGRLAPDVQQIAAFAEDKPPERRRCEGIDPAQLSYERLCRITAVDTPPSFLFWGDSHAGVLMRAARSAATDRGLNGLNATTNGCPPLLNLTNVQRDRDGICLDYNDAVLQLLQDRPELHTIILMGRWARYAEATPYGQESGNPLFMRTRDQAASTVAGNRAMVGEAYTQTLEQLRRLGRRVIVLGPLPEIGHLVPNSMAKATHLSRPVELRLPRRAFDARNRFVIPMLAAGAADTAQWVPMQEALCDADWCRIQQHGLPLYSDDDHLSSVGADLYIPLFGQLLDAPRQEAMP
jgi:peptidoglycan/LPS O-acetylase OafA/YrhL